MAASSASTLTRSGCDAAGEIVSLDQRDDEYGKATVGAGPRSILAILAVIAVRLQCQAEQLGQGSPLENMGTRDSSH